MRAVLIQVDAFTDKPFHGNPAAVCLPEGKVSESWMQAVAAEMNLSETAFLQRRSDGYSIRWFTPETEVPLCGHATLSSAHVLWEEAMVPDAERIVFHSKTGILTARQEGKWICLDFPAYPVKKIEHPRELGLALGTEPVATFRGEPGGYLIELDAEATLRDLKPNFADLRQRRFGPLFVTAPGDGENHDFVSRFFWPEMGIDEDPVTGSAHCLLGPFWGDRLSKSELVGLQLSARRGTVRVRTRKDRVDLLGQAVTVLRGEFLA